MTTPNLPPVEIVEPNTSLWGASLEPAGCQVCGQAHLVEVSRLGRLCPHCGRGKLEPQPARMRPEPPERILPFRLKPADLGPILEIFLKPVWLRPDDLTLENLARRLAPVYLPRWLVDSDVFGDWQMEAGFDYQVQSSQEAYSDQGWQTRQVVETRVRWEPRLGTIARHYDNVPAPALSDDARLAQRLGPYRLEEIVPFEARRLQEQSGSIIVRVPDQPPESAWPLAKEALDRAVASDCLRAAGAQHVRRFTVHAEYRNLNWTQLLLPVYTSFYTDDAGVVHRIIINGQSGAIAGTRLASQRKGWRLAGISAAIAAVFLLLGLACFALTVLFPPIAVLGILLAALAFGIGLFAILPAAWPWQWNKKQAENPT